MADANGGTSKPREFYSTTYASTNQRTTQSFKETPFVLSPQRPTGYSANFRPAIGYTPVMDRSDNPVMLTELKAPHLTVTNRDYPTPHARQALPGSTSRGTPGVSGYVWQIAQTLPRTAAVTAVAVQQDGFTTTSRTLGPPATSVPTPPSHPSPLDRASGHTSNASPAVLHPQPHLCASEHQVSYREPEKPTLRSTLPATQGPAGVGGYVAGTRRPCYLPHSSTVTAGLGPSETSPQLLPSTTHRSFTVLTPAATAPRVAGDCRIEGSGFTQNTKSYVPPPPTTHARRLMSPPPAVQPNPANAAGPVENSFVRYTRYHHWTQAEAFDKTLSQQDSSVVQRQQQTYLFARP